MSKGTDVDGKGGNGWRGKSGKGMRIDQRPFRVPRRSGFSTPYAQRRKILGKEATVCWENVFQLLAGAKDKKPD